MARLPLIDPANTTGHNREIFDGVLKSKRFNMFKALANSPIGLDLFLGPAATLAKGTLTEAEREAIELTTAHANGCDYCQAAHTAIGRHAGLSVEQTIGARRGVIADNPRLDALVRFVAAVQEKRGNISDADFAAFRAGGFSDTQMIEVLGVMALATFTNFFNIANATPLDLPAAPKM
ncbi:MAG: carboxymuconolactone decarboxylase family protein [Phycisphaerales bacterium]